MEVLTDTRLWNQAVNHIADLEGLDEKNDGYCITDVLLSVPEEDTATYEMAECLSSAIHDATEEFGRFARDLDFEPKRLRGSAISLSAENRTILENIVDQMSKLEDDVCAFLDEHAEQKNA